MSASMREICIFAGSASLVAAAGSTLTELLAFMQGMLIWLPGVGSGSFPNCF